MTNIEETIIYTAEKIAEYMKDGNFESFKEMADCYWWTTQDIKEEFRSYANDLELCYIDELEGTLVIGADGSEMNYRSYANKIKKMANELLKKM